MRHSVTVASEENLDLPTEICPACGARKLMPLDSLDEEIERRVFEDKELWACVCGYIEDRDAPDTMNP